MVVLGPSIRPHRLYTDKTTIEGRHATIEVYAAAALTTTHVLAYPSC